jgi:hypothetical protein
VTYMIRGRSQTTFKRQGKVCIQMNVPL